MLQGVPTLYPNGVSNAAPGSFGAGVPMPWPPQYYTWFEDFDAFRADAATTPVAYGDWLVTGTGGSAAVADAFGGILAISSGASDTNAFYAQWQGGNAASVAETFTFVAGKELWFASRFRLVADVTDEAFILGLAVADTTPIDAADGVFFLKADGSTTLTIQEKIATPLSVSANLQTMVAATWYEFAFHYNGIDAIKVYKGGNSDGTWSQVASIAVTALPTTELAVTVGLLSGANNDKTAEIDWIFCARER